jgi:signal transduction histidine kinase
MRSIHLSGMWLLGERETGTSPSPEDLRWLTSLSREAAAVLEAMHYSEQERQAASEMRALYRQVIAAREDEHSRLSRELHDGVLQDLCAVSRDLKALQADEGPNGDPYDHLVDLSSKTVQSLRDICNDLRPPLLQQDLASALKSLVDDMDARSPAPVHIEISTEREELRLPNDVALTIFRITQEGLYNALLHADASEIAVRLTEYPDRLRLTITDDGQGISGGIESAGFVAGGHYGIAGMRERAAMIGGKLDLQSSVGYGTVVILEIPC